MKGQGSVVGHTYTRLIFFQDAAAHRINNGLLGAPPSPPPATEGMDLHPKVPIFEVSPHSHSVANSPAHQQRLD